MTDFYWKITFYFTLVQFVFIFLFFIAIFLVTVRKNIEAARRYRLEHELHRKVGFVILNESEYSLNDFTIPYEDRSVLFRIIEYFDGLYISKAWENLKMQLVSQRLLPEARRRALKRRWRDRYFAARSFVLYPQPCDTDIHLRLLEDKDFYIRVLASKCLIQLPTRENILAVLQAMTREPISARYPYLDAILHQGTAALIQVIATYRSNTTEALREVCLQILSHEPYSSILQDIRKDIRSPNKYIRRYVSEILGRQPCEESRIQLLSFLSDEDPVTRKLACQHLSMYQEDAIIKRLSRCLHDENWEVCQQAALSLCKLGNRGRDILLQQRVEQDPKAYRIARYALTLPLGLSNGLD